MKATAALQKEVTRLYEEGKTRREIMAELGISDARISYFIQRVTFNNNGAEYDALTMDQKLTWLLENGTVRKHLARGRNQYSREI